MKKFKTVLFVMLAVCMPMVVALGCGGGNEQEQRKPVSYGTAVINYHYDYDSAIETYYQEKYSAVIGETYTVDKLYTPPVKLGRKFLGWTTSAGGAGEVITSLDIEGAGGSGKHYSLYAKYEEITFNVVYHLNGGTNNANNAETVTGSAKLYDPTKLNAEFQGWYYDEGFDSYASRIELQNNDQTQIDLYAKWRHTYIISYKSDIGNLPVHGDGFNKSYKEGFGSDIEINLYEEYFPGYLYLGWTYEGQSEPQKRVEKYTIKTGTTGDLDFTANYLKATGGAYVNMTTGAIIFTVDADTDEVVVADVMDRRTAGAGISYSYYKKITIKYSGETQPKVVCNERYTDIIEFERAEEE